MHVKLTLKRVFALKVSRWWMEKRCCHPHSFPFVGVGDFFPFRYIEPSTLVRWVCPRHDEAKDHSKYSPVSIQSTCGETFTIRPSEEFRARQTNKFLEVIIDSTNQESGICASRIKRMLVDVRV